MEADPGCESCREGAEETVRWGGAARLLPQARSAGGNQRLRSRRRAALTQRTALHLAAAFTLRPRGACGCRVQSFALGAYPSAAARFSQGTARRTSAGRASAVAHQEPDFLAALLRQARCR